MSEAGFSTSTEFPARHPARVHVPTFAQHAINAPPAPPYLPVTYLFVSGTHRILRDASS
jgi:hypothetical protein